MAIGTAVVGVGLSVAQYADQKNKEKKAQAAINQFDYQDLENPYQDLQVSTLGADLRREEQARTTGTLVDALQQGGTRAILGGIGGVQAQSNIVNREIAANLDEQQRRIDQLAAGQSAQNQQTRVRREDEQLAGYGQQLDVARHGQSQALTSGFNAIGGLAQAYQNRGAVGAVNPNTVTPQQQNQFQQPTYNPFGSPVGASTQYNTGLIS